MNIEQILEHAEKLSIDNNYWFVRTMSGDYYDDFITNGFIAIGHNEIPFSEIKKAKESSDAINYLGNYIKEKVDVKNYKYWALQHLRFAYEIKENDIVIVPSASSRRIGICKVLSSQVEVVNPKMERNNECPFVKRKKIKLLKEIYREEIASEVFQLFTSRHVITNANKYIPYIDSRVHDFYLKGDDAHLVVHIGLNDNLNAFEVNDFYTQLLFFIEDFSSYSKVPFDRKKLNVKLNLQSPGAIIFFGALAVGILGLGAMVVLAGGIFESNVDPQTGKNVVKFKTNSLLDKISAYKNSSLERKQKLIELEERMKRLNVRPIKDIKSLTDFTVEKSDDKIQNTN
jgi:restriction system protein